jgi:protein-S-isoprenylcysteine O-methyltransferase Ste14
MSDSHKARGAIVDANYRFIAASQEVNARITQRQQALALYVTLVVSLLAALVALKPSEGRSTVPVEWLMMGFPVASVCLAFLNYKAERAITNLRRFMSALEQLNDAHEVLPSYNTHPGWAEGANKARRFHDYAAAVLVSGGNVVGLGAVMTIYPQRIAESPATLWASVVVAMLSVLALLLSPRWSYQPIVPVA